MVMLVWPVLALSAAARAHGVEQTEITKVKSCQSSYFTGSAIKVSQRAKKKVSQVFCGYVCVFGKHTKKAASRA